MNSPHRCRCKDIQGCTIHVHPDSDIQLAVESLIMKATQYDSAESDRRTYIIVVSLYSGGEFTSITGDVSPEVADSIVALVRPIS